MVMLLGCIEVLENDLFSCGAAWMCHREACWWHVGLSLVPHCRSHSCECFTFLTSYHLSTLHSYHQSGLLKLQPSLNGKLGNLTLTSLLDTMLRYTKSILETQRKRRIQIRLLCKAWIIWVKHELNIGAMLLMRKIKRNLQLLPVYWMRQGT